MEANSYQHCFAPVLRADTRLVILGSLPGVASLAAGQYYAHPRNQFWTLLGAVLGVDLAGLDYAQRLQQLLAHRVGLWDVVARAERRGSLDSNLREVEINRLEQLQQLAPQLQAVACNGLTAGRQLPRLQALGLSTVQLPSSSPALTRPYAEKLQQWLQLRQYL